MSDTMPTTALAPLEEEIASGPRFDAFAFFPNTPEGRMRAIQALSETDLVPKEYQRKPFAIIAAAQLGAELGISLMTSLKYIAVINGKPGIYGDLPLALVQRSRLLERHKEWFTGEGETQTAHCLVKRKGDPDELEYTFSVKEANVATLWKKQGPWSQYPKRMLMFRARGFALRDKFADKLLGVDIWADRSDPIDIDATTSDPPAPAATPEEAKTKAERVLEKIRKPSDGAEPQPATLDAGDQPGDRARGPASAPTANPVDQSPTASEKLEIHLREMIEEAKTVEQVRAIYDDAVMKEKGLHPSARARLTQLASARMAEFGKFQAPPEPGKLL
jgi:hypothetical protein